MRIARFWRVWRALCYWIRPGVAGGQGARAALLGLWLCGALTARAADPITFDPIDNFSIWEDSTNTLAVTNVLGGGTITVEATSSDTAILPDPTATYDDLFAQALLDLTPVAQATGTVTITLTLANEVSTNTVTFDVTVDWLNRAPSFSLSTNWVDAAEDAGETTIPNFTADHFAGATNESGQALAFTVLDAPVGFFATPPGIDASGTLTFTTATNKYGTNVLRIVLQDDGGTANGGVDAVTNTFTLAVANVYDVPFVTPLTNWVFNENTGKTNIALTVHAIENNTVTVAAASSATDVFNVAVTGTATSTTRTLSITTVTNQYGTGNVTLVVGDATVSTTNTFQVAVQQINHPPTASKISNVAVREDFATTNFAFTVAKFRGNVSNVTVTAWSYNTNVIANENLALSGEGTNRVLTVSPTTNAYGQSTIFLMLTDTNLDRTTNTFVMTLLSVNDPPSFSLSTNLFVVDENSGTQSFSGVLTGYSTGPTNESSQTCKMVVSPSNPGLFSMAPTLDTNGVLTFKTATNAHGLAVCRVYAQDSGGTANGGSNSSPTNTIYIVAKSVVTPPTITMATNVVIPRTKSTNLTVTVSDPDGRNIQAAATSADTNVATVTLRGTGKSRTLTIQPTTLTNGATTITVTAYNGLLTATSTVPVEVQAVNYAPVMSTLTALTINENAAVTNRSFTVSDFDTAVSSVLVTARVYNTNLATAAVSTSDYTNRVLAITPVADVYGSTTVDLIADDQTGSKTARSTNRFLLTVNLVNQAPTFTVTTNALVTGENAGTTATRALRVYTNLITSISPGPASEKSQAVTFFAAASSNAFFATKPAITTKGVLSFRTALYATGTVSIALWAQDNGGTLNGGKNLSITNTLTLTVTNVNQAPAITTLANLTLKEGAGPTNLLVSSTDVDEERTNLNIRAVCNKPMLATVAATNAAGVMWLTLTPVGDTNSATLVDGKMLGSATISVMVDDGVLTNTNSFALTVLPVNDPPSFTLGGTATAAKYLVEQIVSNQVSNVVLGPTSDETNQSWSATAAIAASDAWLFARPPSIDKRGTLHYTPNSYAGSATVSVMLRDSGGASGGGNNASTVQTFNIVIPSNPFMDLVGEYNGLFYTPTNFQNDQAGFIRFAVQNSGGFTCALLFGGASNQVSGQFNIAGQGTASWPAKNLVLTLDLDVAGNSEAITGTVSNTAAHWSVPLLALRSAVGTETVLPVVGNYQLLVVGPGGSGASVPAGDGILRINAGPDGQISVGGWLADGQVVTQRVGMTKYAEWPLYLPAYGRGLYGGVYGWVTFTDTNVNSAVLSNNLAWVKTAGAGGTNFTGGFTNVTPALASTYYPWDGLWLSNAKAIIGGGNLAAPLTNIVDVAYDSVQVVSNLCQLKLSIDPGKGLLTGSFVDPASGATRQINALILPMQQQARGWFLGTNAGGYFWLK